MGKQARVSVDDDEAPEPSPQAARQLLKKFDGAIWELRYFFDDVEGRLDRHLLEYLANDPKLRDAVDRVSDQLGQLCGRNMSKRMCDLMIEVRQKTEAPPTVPAQPETLVWSSTSDGIRFTASTV